MQFRINFVLRSFLNIENIKLKVVTTSKASILLYDILFVNIYNPNVMKICSAFDYWNIINALLQDHMIMTS